MDTIAKSDIFFFVTTIAVVILAILIALVTIYLIKILNDLKHITKRAKTEADLIAGDIGLLRENIKRDGAKLKFLASFFNNLKNKSNGSKKTPK